LKVLVADDEFTSRATLKKLLTKWGYDVVVCSDGLEAWEIMRGNDAPKLAILDWMMPSMDGLELCRAVRGREDVPYTYIIILTAKGEREDIVEAMEAGADDFINKPFNSEELKVRLRAGRRVLNLQMELISERESFKFQATHDILTGLPNRTLLNDRLTMELARARRSKSLLGVLYLDIDRFKVINDTLGHAVGDKLLQGIGKRLVKIIRRCDTIARLGGDEFVVLLPQIKKAKHATKVAKRIIDTLKSPFYVENSELYISPSIGIVTYPYHGKEVKSLLKNADTAMYKAKEEGKNTYRVYEPSMSEKAIEIMSLESDLRKALVNEEFVLYYQPQVDLLTGKMIGMEALIRWQHPSLGFVSPLRFIDIAEETGLIAPMGEWVIRTACKQNRAWQKAGYQNICISVNVSVRQFQHQNLLKLVSQILLETKLDAKWLGLEITESDIMINPHIAIETLYALHNMGIKLSIDDFGTGYSSLSYLKRLPVDVLKIDRSFILDITENSDDAVITKAIIAMAKSLRLGVIAEGVETIEQLKLLQFLECYKIQGYLFSKPLSREGIEKLLTDKVQFKSIVEAKERLSTLPMIENL